VSPQRVCKGPVPPPRGYARPFAATTKRRAFDSYFNGTLTRARLNDGVFTLDQGGQQKVISTLHLRLAMSVALRAPESMSRGS
jgi:hypothetical protein